MSLVFSDISYLCWKFHPSFVGPFETSGALILGLTQFLQGEATVTLTALRKCGVSKWDILKSPVSHVLNFLGWINPKKPGLFGT